MKTTHFLDSNNRTGCVIGTLDVLKEVATSFDIEIRNDEELEAKHPGFYEKISELEKTSETDFSRTYHGENPFARDSITFLIKQFSKGTYIVDVLEGIDFYIEGNQFCEIDVLDPTESHILFDLDSHPDLEDTARDILEFVNNIEAPVKAQLLPSHWRIEWSAEDTRYVFAEHPKCATKIRIYQNGEMIYNYDLTNLKGFELLEEEKAIYLKHNLLTYMYFLYLYIRYPRSDVGKPYPPRKIFFEDREKMRKFNEILELLSERKTRIVNPIRQSPRI